MYIRQHKSSSKNTNHSETPETNQLLPSQPIYQPKVEEIRPQQNSTNIQAQINDDILLNSGPMDGAVFSRQVERPKPRGLQMKSNIKNSEEKHKQETENQNQITIDQQLNQGQVIQPVNNDTVIQCGKMSPSDRLKALEQRNLVLNTDTKNKARGIKTKPKNTNKYLIKHPHSGRIYYVRQDKNKRTIKIAGEIAYTNAKRKATLKVKNKRKDDASGHLIAHSLGGPPTLNENYVAMSKQINSAGGDWGKIEDYIRTRLQQKGIKAWMAVMPSYPNDTMNRPHEIEVKLRFNRSPFVVHLKVPTT